MPTDEALALRQMLIDAIRGHQAHLDFDSAVKDFPPQARGVKPATAPHTAWQLVEHMRIAQRDILEFSRHPKHKSPEWPEGYWPSTDAPPDDQAWDATIRAFRRDERDFEKLIQDPTQDLFRPFEHGDGQTLLREALLIASHNSYHLGQLVFLKKMLLEK
ncbi:MAG: DinB family protein [Bryobacteraceae bacterium]